MQLTGENLACVRGGRQVFSRLSFSLARGEGLVGTGRNGVGKSSLLRCIAGLVRLAGGQLKLDGAERETSVGEQAHYLGHQDAAKTSLTVRENLSFWSQYLGAGLAAIEAAVDAVDLAPLAGFSTRYPVARAPRPLWRARGPTPAA